MPESPSHALHLNSLPRVAGEGWGGGAFAVAFFSSEAKGKSAPLPTSPRTLRVRGEGFDGVAGAFFEERRHARIPVPRIAFEFPPPRSGGGLGWGCFCRCFFQFRSERQERPPLPTSPRTLRVRGEGFLRRARVEGACNVAMHILFEET